jgi:phenylalanyl-tRNA synthetase alpha chain
MEKNNPPIKIIVPGTCYRYEATDARHEFQFKQIEGLMIDKNISLANFKYIMHEVVKNVFGNEIKTRFLPSFFPFVSPGLQMDISCFKCNGKNKNCDLCHGSGWLEVMGAGMVHKELYRHAGFADYDFQGFAFGLGVERFAMVKYGINDIRLFNSGDLRFTKQF